MCFHASDGKSYATMTPFVDSNDWIAKKETIIRIDVDEEILKSLASMCISNWLNIQNEKSNFSEFVSDLLSVKLLRTEGGHDYTVKEWTGTEFKS